VGTTKLTDQQSLRIADLPESYRVVGFDRSAPFVRKPTGEMLRIQQDGRLTAATVAAKRQLAAIRASRAGRRGVRAATPYTDVMD
jgi:hypothetical protein